MPANKELIRKAVDALRSGEYTQGQGRLKFRDLETGVTKHCCLGVMEEVAETPSECRVTGTFVFRPTLNAAGRLTGAASALSRETAALYGMDSTYGLCDGDIVLMDEYTHPETGERGVLTAIMANDRYGWTFDQIADALEARYLA